MGQKPFGRPGVQYHGDLLPVLAHGNPVLSWYSFTPHPKKKNNH